MRPRTTITAATAVYRPEYTRRLFLGWPRSLMLYPVSINVGDTRLALADLGPITVSYKPPNYFGAVVNTALSSNILIFFQDMTGAPAAALVVALFAAAALLDRTTLKDGHSAALRYTLWGRPAELEHFAGKAEETRFEEVLRVDRASARGRERRC